MDISVFALYDTQVDVTLPKFEKYPREVTLWNHEWPNENFKMQVQNLKSQCNKEQLNGYCQQTESLKMKVYLRNYPRTQREK